MSYGSEKFASATESQIAVTEYLKKELGVPVFLLGIVFLPGVKKDFYVLEIGSTPKPFRVVIHECSEDLDFHIWAYATKAPLPVREVVQNILNTQYDLWVSERSSERAHESLAANIDCALFAPEIEWFAEFDDGDFIFRTSHPDATVLQELYRLATSGDSYEGTFFDFSKDLFQEYYVRPGSSQSEVFLRVSIGTTNGDDIREAITKNILSPRAQEVLIPLAEAAFAASPS